MKIYPFFYIFVSTYLNCLSIFGQENLSNSPSQTALELFSPLLAEIRDLPPLEFELDFGFELENGSFQMWTYKFVQSGRMWRRETVDETGKTRNVTSFDGERYYYWSVTGENLHVTSKPEEYEFIDAGVFNAFMDNPIYGWCFPFFLDSRSNFRPSTLSLVGTWSDILSGFDVSSVEAGNGKLRLLFDAPHLQFETMFGGQPGAVKRVEEIILRHRNRVTGEFRDSQTRISFNGWEVANIAEQAIVFPNEIVGVSRHNNGVDIVGGDTWLRVKKGSLKALSSKPDKSFFRVPLSAVPDPQIHD